jgi:hypothetical protein
MASPFKFLAPVNKINGVGLGQIATIEFPPLIRIATAMLTVTVTKAALGSGQYSIPKPSDGVGLLQFKVGGNPQRTRTAAQLFGANGLNALCDANNAGTVVYTQSGNSSLSVVPVLIGSAADTAQQALLTANTITVATFQLPIVFGENFRKTYTDAEILALTTGFDDGSGIGLVTLECTIPANSNITAVALLAAVEYDNAVAKAGSAVRLSKEYTHNVQYAAAGDIEVATQLYNRDALQRVRLLTTADRITKVVVKMGQTILRQTTDVQNQAFLAKADYNVNALASNAFDIEFDLNDDPASAPLLTPSQPLSIVATLATANDSTKNITVLSSYYGGLD